MLSNQPIRALYELALAEGEGVGTAYEYYVKRIVLRKWLVKQDKPEKVLIAGLPEKYGASLDFVLLAVELGAQVDIVDERSQALARSQSAFSEIMGSEGFEDYHPRWKLSADLSKLAEAAGPYDLALSSEVLQRLAEKQRAEYVQSIRKLAPAAALFAPNADNPSHTNLSGLSGLTLEEMRALHPQLSNSGLIDMPPFPPGMTRTDEQREQATTGSLEALAMWGLGLYASLEKLVPGRIKRRQAHIVFALS